jgi:hypothetical protein
MSSHRPIPLYPCPLFSPHQAQGELELPSDEYSDFPPIREHKSTFSPHQAQEDVELPNDEYSDFPPIREHKSITPTNRFRPRSLVVRKGSKRCSSPTQSEPSPSKLPRHSRRQNKGLGCKDILNTIEVPMLQRYPKVSN